MKKIINLLFLLCSYLSFAQNNSEYTPYPITNGRIDTCSGYFFDSGGFDNHYGNNENFTFTICPDDEDSYIVLDFESFITEANADTLTVFAGDNANGAAIATYSGHIEEPFSVIGNLATSNGCLTFVFESDDQNTMPGWRAKISCRGECQNIRAVFAGSIPAIDPGVRPVCPEDVGVIRVCKGTPFTLKADGVFERNNEGAKYEWILNRKDENLNNIVYRGKEITTQFNEEGSYKFSLVAIDSEGCRSKNLVSVVIQVSSNEATIDLSADKPNYCLNETIYLDSEVELKKFDYEPIPPVAGTTFIPDGRDLYTTSIFVDQFCLGQTLEDMNHVRVCLNMEHSFMGDLIITLVAPNGQRVLLHNQAGGARTFGHPRWLQGREADEAEGPGIGWNYCFDMTPGNIIVGGPGVATTAVSMPPQGNVRQAANPGTYLPVDSFQNFVGTELNGEWRIEILDQLAVDNGWIFSWSLEFDESIVPSDLSFAPEVKSERWIGEGIVNLEDGRAMVRPVTPGTYTYTYEVTDNFNCIYTKDITVTVDPVLFVNSPSNLNACMDQETRRGTFNLRDVQASVSSNPNVIYNYYESEENAQLDINAIDVNQVVHINNSPKQIWFRAVDPGMSLNCFTVDHFNLVVNNCALQLRTLDNLIICNPATIFDLTVQTPIVYNNAPGFTVTYYTTQADAATGNNAIPTADLANFTGTHGQTIYVRVQSNTNLEAYATTSFRLFIEEVPTIFPVDEIFGCPINAEKSIGEFNLSLSNLTLTGGRPNLIVSYYATEANAIAGLAANRLPNIYQNTATTIWARVEHARTKCFVTTPIDLIVADIPDHADDVTIFNCSTNNDGIAEFSTSTITYQLFGNILPNISVRYFTSQADAQRNINNLSDTFTNTIPNNQTIYARIAFDRSGCFEIVPIELVISRSPRIVEPTPFAACVESQNREVIYNLHLKESEILGGQNAANFEITYYLTENNAHRGEFSIENADTFSNTTAYVVWVRVEDRTTGCYAVTRLVLTTKLLPNVPAMLPTYKLCSAVENNGIGTFDLLGYKNVISNGQRGLIISYHKTEADADTNRNSLPNSYQNEVAYYQTIFVRIENEAGCHVVRTLALRVDALPTLNISNDPFQVCSYGETGVTSFNLVDIVNTIQVGVVGLEYHFYELEENAYNDIDRILTPTNYTNIQPGVSIIWVKALDPVTRCFTVKPLRIVVVAAPTLPVALENLVMCTDRHDGTSAIFDLTDQNERILAEQQVDPANISIVYYLSEDDALNKRNRITTPEVFTNTILNQRIWVRIENTVTKCYVIGSFLLEIKNPLEIATVLTPIELCQDSSLPGVSATFNLHERESELLLGVEVFGAVFGYYESKEDAENNRNPIQNTRNYVNRTNPQTIWISVEGRNGCRSIRPLVIRVKPLPVPNFNPKPLEMCEFQTRDGKAEFNLRLAEEDMRNQDPNLLFSYFESEADATANLNAIPFPTNYVTGTRIVWVRVAKNNGGVPESCFVLVQLPLKVNLQPYFGPLSPYTYCLDNPSPFAKFDLRTKFDEILDGRNAADYTITFYTTLNGAMNDSNPLLYDYTNIVAFQQEIYVRLTDKKTGCFYVDKLILSIEQKVVAFPIDLTDKTRIEVCATPAGSGGTATFNLNLFTDEIKGAQVIDPADLEVEYYYRNALIDVADLGRFVLPIGSHEIVAIIKQVGPAGTVFYCQDETRFTLTVFETPIAPVLPTSTLVCIDYNTKKLVDPYTIDSGFKAGDYEFQWERRNGTIGAFTPIAGATKSYYVVESIEQGNMFRVVVKYKGQQCSNTSNAIILNTVEEIKIKIMNADSKGILGAIDGEERISIVVESPTDARLFEFALDEGAYQDSRVFYDVLNGTHRVWVRYKDQRSICPQYVDIFVLGYPKFFTPNGDGFNDTWNIPTLKGHPEAVIYIYDRYGKLLSQFTPANGGWDGTFNGKPMPSTDYWFTVEYLEEAKQANQVPRKVQYKGHFSLKR
ncbi:T9SS type B sorting domain-containing protein [Myroides sp. 1354]|uniref:T9SS type B sorting domain-containing protein n=1 Tax=unclassified Myroides TaxID=2642485 RepID=UPI002576B723|nr:MULTISPECIES: T9SS type B sorting domain-containing protein [unclassified Myroides]MDM1044230.1 T9SS type B sorting domain-containing protein [Myroides sp. R163-1]MDM1055166.1 T9SS type B sorting domain-containing protein [Myroides sp. 1354]MDM1068463.1 T9SS type B sorting domain-containing protein [Myroides sp. 1372]